MSAKPWRLLGLSDGEYELIVEQIGRDPNPVELHMYSVMWSEHCSYKHSRRTLRLLPVEGPRVLQGPGENAGVVDIGEGWAAVFKIESHNHPSAIEPYQGAATGVGGILRDIYTMGAQPVALLNSLRFGSLDSARVRYLFDGVVAGIGGYGNCVGIPTVGGEIYFETCYEGNPLVNAMCLGVMPREDLVLGKACGEGNLLVLAGAATGRDGIHGVTFASEGLSEQSEEKRPAVQVGDPFVGKQLLDATLAVIRAGLVAGVQDLGGAGLTCALSETAARAGTGVAVDLEKVPLREEDMEAHEILTSESQERMLLVVEPGRLAAVEEIYRAHGLEPAVLGQVTGGGRLVARFRGREVVNLPAESLSGGAPAYEPEAREPSYFRELARFDPLSLDPPADLGEALLTLLAAPDLASREWVWRRYDYGVRTATVQGPGGDAAVLRLRETGTALALSVDGSGRLTYLNPRLGGMLAVAEATRNLSCCGAEPVGITDCLNFGSPEQPEVFWQFREAVEGMAAACRALEVPVVGGNVSFYNESAGEAIYPTPVVGAVGLLKSPQEQVGPAFCQEGHLVFLLGAGEISLGGSQYLKELYGRVAGSPSTIDLALEKRLQALLRELIGAGLVLSAHDLSEGGLAVALAESALAGGIGARVKLPPSKHPHLDLFGEGPSRALVSLERASAGKISDLAGAAGVTLLELGTTGGDSLVIRGGEALLMDLPLERMGRVHREVFTCLMK